MTTTNTVDAARVELLLSELRLPTASRSSLPSLRGISAIRGPMSSLIGPRIETGNQSG
jgi:hypothetical protein